MTTIAYMYVYTDDDDYDGQELQIEGGIRPLERCEQGFCVAGLDVEIWSVTAPDGSAYRLSPRQEERAVEALIEAYKRG